MCSVSLEKLKEIFSEENIEDIKQKASTQLKFMISSIIDDPKLSLDQKREFIQTLLQEYNLLNFQND